ncbi:hypothetical protein TREMEDRAFT_64856 [Tremella mesenterica DSM 1558]|nr:uncharacterized protein TREMEDRAFT_64856 [Tremella mesenterica DSM 1558]EIW66992.1 hypothetical protein TREMEDRAFT_64856 [Tremella mesenterica DSM 1558]
MADTAIAAPEIQGDKVMAVEKGKARAMSPGLVMNELLGPQTTTEEDIEMLYGDLHSKRDWAVNNDSFGTFFGFPDVGEKNSNTAAPLPEIYDFEHHTQFSPTYSHLSPVLSGTTQAHESCNYNGSGEELKALPDEPKNMEISGMNLILHEDLAEAWNSHWEEHSKQQREQNRLLGETISSELTQPNEEMLDRRVEEEMSVQENVSLPPAPPTPEPEVMSVEEDVEHAPVQFNHEVWEVTGFEMRMSERKIYYKVTKTYPDGRIQYCTHVERRLLRVPKGKEAHDRWWSNNPNVKDHRIKKYLRFTATEGSQAMRRPLSFE